MVSERCVGEVFSRVTRLEHAQIGILQIMARLVLDINN